MTTSLRQAELPRVHTSVVAMLEHTASEFPQRLALVMGEEQLNYRQLSNAVAGLARVLVAGGSQRQRVATVLANSLVACIAPYAIAAAGAQHVPLNPQYTARELQYMLRDSAPHLLIVQDSLLEKVRLLCGGLPDCTLLAASLVRQQLASWRDMELQGGLATLEPDADSMAILQWCLLQPTFRLSICKPACRCSRLGNAERFAPAVRR